LGIGAVAVVIGRAGATDVLNALKNSAKLFPLAVLLEGGILACSTFSLRSLYGEVRRQLPKRAWIRAGLWGFVAMLIVPAGRAAAEVLRGALLSKEGGGHRAAVAVVHMQGVALMATSLASAWGALAAYLSGGSVRVPALIAGNAVLTFTLGAGIVFAQQKARWGAFLGKLFPRARTWGQAVDESAAGARPQWMRALAWETAGRLLQGLQYAVYVVAVGGVFGVREGLAAQGIHLVGASLGDLVPGQLGVSEANFALSAQTLSISVSQAAAVGVLAHAGQLGLMALCGLGLLFLKPATRPVPDTDAGAGVLS
jgi:hypothetical protein